MSSILPFVGCGSGSTLYEYIEIFRPVVEKLDQSV